MILQQQIGQRGEQMAAAYLMNEGSIIKERNWRFSKAEIDINAEIKDLLVFLEVKTKSYTY